MTEQCSGAVPGALHGQSVRAARLESGLSMRSLARAIGVSPATLSAVETGRTPLTVDRLYIIARALGTSPERLLSTPHDAIRHRRPSGSQGATGPNHDASANWRTFAPLDLDPVTDSAIAVFVRAGYHGATMRQIAAGAGMSVPGVYHHYASKQELLVRILDRTMADLRWRVLAARDENGRPADQFARMVEALALFHTMRRDLAFIGASEMRSLVEPDRTRIADLRNEVQYLLDAVVAEAISAGEFETSHPHAAGRAVATMCTALPQWFRADGSSSPQEIAREYAGFAVALMRAK